MVTGDASTLLVTMLGIGVALAGVISTFGFSLRSAIRTMRADLNGRVDDLGARVDRMEQGLGARIDDLGTRVDQVEKGLGARIDDLSARIDDLGARVDRVDGRLDRLETRLDGRIDRLEMRLDTLIDRLARPWPRTNGAPETAEPRQEQEPKPTP